MPLLLCGPLLCHGDHARLWSPPCTPSHCSLWVHCTAPDCLPVHPHMKLLLSTHPLFACSFSGFQSCSTKESEPGLFNVPVSSTLGGARAAAAANMLGRRQASCRSRHPGLQQSSEMGGWAPPRLVQACACT